MSDIDLIDIPDEIRELERRYDTAKADMEAVRRMLNEAKEALAPFKVGDVLYANVDAPSGRRSRRMWQRCEVSKVNVSRMYDHEVFIVSYSVRPFNKDGKPSQRTRYADRGNIRTVEEHEGSTS